VTLAEILDEAAAGLEPLERLATATGAQWRRDGRPFAVLAGVRAEFRLAPIVGRAALGTPDTFHSDRGSDWIAFEPRDLDRASVDRAAAWFASAWRHALEQTAD